MAAGGGGTRTRTPASAPAPLPAPTHIPATRTYVVRVSPSALQPAGSLASACFTDDPEEASTAGATAASSASSSGAEAGVAGGDVPTYMAPFQMVAASASTDGMPSLPCMHNVAVDVASPEASAPASVVRGGGAPAGGSSSGGRPAAAAPPRPVRMFEAVDALTDAPLFVAATSSERVPPLTRWERSATKPQTAAVSMLASLLRSVAARARAKKAARMEWHELMAWDRDDMADVVPNDVAFAITVRHVGDLVVPRATGRWSAAALADARFSYVAYRARVSHPDTLQRAVDITTQLVAVRLHDTSVRREVAKAALTGARVPVTVHAALMEAGLPAHVRFVAVPRTRPCTTGEASALRDAGDTGGAVGARVTGFAAAQLTD